MYQAVGQLERAVAAGEKAVEADRGDFRSYVALAGSYARCGQHGRAAEISRQATNLAPESGLA